MSASRRFPVIPGYKILRCAGEGGMGAVFHAKRLDDGAQVAIKLTLSQDRYLHQRFALECETLAGLNQHPGICRYVDRGTVDGLPYLILEWLGDGSLADRLEHGAIAPLAALGIVAGVADALHFMHQKGLIHRDIKPANILFRGNQPVVADLGIVRVAQSQLTQAGAVLGTAEYMSPEQIQGLEIDGRSDFYSLGVMLHEMLTGVQPFQADKHLPLHEYQIETCKLHLLASPPPLPRQVEWLQSLTHAMMAKTVAQRPASIRVQIQQLLDADDDRLAQLAQIEAATTYLELIYENRFPSVPDHVVLRPAGHGGMATVYLAISKKLNRKVALKVLGKFSKNRQQEEARFKREAATLARISHDHVCRIYDSGVSADQAYLVLEWLPTGSLADRISAGCTLADALTWVLQISAALAVAHEKNIIHRDLKPANVMLREGIAVLTDFGIARDLGSSLSATGTVLGTPAYMSPEQIQGQRAHTYSDIYSLGILLYELLVGRTPYLGETQSEVAMQHLVAPIPTLPREYSDLQPLLDRMLAKQPEQRIADCATVDQELRRIVRESESLQRLLQNRSEANSAQLNQLGVSLEWKPDNRLQARVQRRWRHLKRWWSMRPKAQQRTGLALALVALLAPTAYLVLQQREQTIIPSEALDSGTRTALGVLESEFTRSTESGRLFEPETKSAAYYLIKMRTVRPNADITVRAEARFLDAVAARALAVDQAGDPRAADALISGAESLFPAERISGLKQQLAEIRIQREYEERLSSLLDRVAEIDAPDRMATLITEALATELGPRLPQLQQALRERILAAFARQLEDGELTTAHEWQQQLARVDATAALGAGEQLRRAQNRDEIRRLREQLPDWRLADLGGLAAAAGVLERIEKLGDDVNTERESWQQALDQVLENELDRQRYEDMLSLTEPFTDRLSPRGQALLSRARAAKERRDRQQSLGTVALQVSPWGRVLEVRDAQGAVVDLSGALSSRGDLRLPAGRYQVQIEDGWSRQQASLAVQVQAQETTRVTHRFGEIDPDRYAELAGIAP